jgi:hypothetical protein
MTPNNTQTAPNSATPAIQFRQIAAEQREKLVAGIVRRAIEHNTQIGPFAVHHMRGSVPFVWVELKKVNFAEALAFVKSAPAKHYDSRTRLWAVPLEWYSRRKFGLDACPRERKLQDLVIQASDWHVYHEAGCEAQIRVHRAVHVATCTRNCEAHWKAKGF